jgi:hypothetical protein
MGGKQRKAAGLKRGRRERPKSQWEATDWSASGTPCADRRLTVEPLKTGRSASQPVPKRTSAAFPEPTSAFRRRTRVTQLHHCLAKTPRRLPFALARGFASLCGSPSIDRFQTALPFTKSDRLRYMDERKGWCTAEDDTGRRRGVHVDASMRAIRSWYVGLTGTKVRIREGP